MAFSQDDIDALKSSIASGALRVRYADGREVFFRTLAEMRETLRMMENDVSPAAKPPRTLLAGF